MKNIIPKSIKVLADDIYTSDYTNVHDCAITRSLQRAGIAGRDGVGVIYGIDTLDNLARFVEEDYLIIQGMYKFVEPRGWEENIVPIEPYDFDLRIYPNE